MQSKVKLVIVILWIAARVRYSVKSFNMDCECGQRKVTETEERECTESQLLADKED